MHEHEHDPAAQAAEWDARYGEGDGTMWSGRPNGRLVNEVADLAPGGALDVGCGEGADAIWLAQRGWTVTAIDISDLAVSRAREAAERAGVAIEWVCGDALRTPFPARSFDLVTMQYPALPKAAGEAAVRTLLDTVRTGGLMLAVYHDLDDAHREHITESGSLAERRARNLRAEVLGIGNPALFWGAFVVIPYLALTWALRKEWQAGAILVPILVQVLPWLVVSRPLWAHFGSLVNGLVLLGFPVAGAWAVRAVRMEGRAPWRAALGWLSLAAAPRTGTRLGRADRMPARGVRYRPRTWTAEADLDRELGGQVR